MLNASTMCSGLQNYEEGINGYHDEVDDEPALQIPGSGVKGLGWRAWV